MITNTLGWLFMAVALFVFLEWCLILIGLAL